MGKQKYISTLMIASLLTPNISNAYIFNYNYHRNRVRWSPHTHSLISGRNRHSPYSPKKLINNQDVKWSIYSSSLINERESYIYSTPKQININLINSITYQKKPQDPKLQSQKQRKPLIRLKKQEIQKEIQRRKEFRKNDPVNTVCDYLKNKDIVFKRSHGLNISGQTIGTHFILEKPKILILILSMDLNRTFSKDMSQDTMERLFI